MKRDIKIEMSVSQYYRKLGDNVGNTPTGKLLTKAEQEHLKDLYYQYALKVEREEQEALKMYKIRNYKRGKK
ncbi:hypothetical protein [Robertmurraya sp.]|uniref:hypothetical protein n=1 Tax=Robertmurraya sp. TaxID=2837525 RepID=UPI003704451C